MFFCPDGENFLALFVLQVDTGAAPAPAPAAVADDTVVIEAAPEYPVA